MPDGPVLAVEVTRGAPPREWDAQAAGMLGSGPFQTTGWAAFMAAYLNAEPFFLIARERDRAIGMLMLVRVAIRRLSWLERPGEWLVVGLLSRFLPELTWTHGPLVDPDVDSGRVCRAITEHVDRLASKTGAVSVTGTTVMTPDAIRIARSVQEAFAERQYAVAPEATLVVALPSEDDALMRAFKPSARKAIRRARAAGVTVRQLAERSDLDWYWRLVRDWRSRLGLKTFSVRNFTALWDCMPREAMAIFVAEQGGEPVGGLGIWAGSKVAVEFTAVQSERANRDRLFVGDMLKVEALRWARARGCAFFDLAGIALSPTTSKEAGIRQFKEKWGGDLVIGARISRRLRFRA